MNEFSVFPGQNLLSTLDKFWITLGPVLHNKNHCGILFIKRDKQSNTRAQPISSL